MQSFDSLGYCEELKKAGVPENQAKIQADLMRNFRDGITNEIEKAVNAYDISSRKDLATKGDIQDVRAEIQDVRDEIQGVRGEIQDLRNEIKETKSELVKWTASMVIGLAALMITCFGITIAIIK